MKQRSIKSPLTLLIFIPIAIGTIFNSSNAQIVYTDVNPDISIICPPPICNSSCHKNFTLDLNNDGVVDYTFSINTVHSCTVVSLRLAEAYIICTDSNKVCFNGSYPKLPTFIGKNAWEVAMTNLLKTLSSSQMEIILLAEAPIQPMAPLMPHMEIMMLTLLKQMVLEILSGKKLTEAVAMMLSIIWLKQATVIFMQ